jgi:hypothetical protein
MAVEDDIVNEMQGGAEQPKALSGSAQANFETAKQSGPLSQSAVEAAENYAKSIGTTFDKDKGYSRENFLEKQAQGRMSNASYQDAARESRIANRRNFFAPVEVDQFGNQTAMTQIRGPQGQLATARPPSEVRRIMTEGVSGPQDQKRLDRFKRSTAGQGFNWGGFQSSLAKLRRQTLGQKEFERQMDMAFREGPSKGEMFKSWWKAQREQISPDDGMVLQGQSNILDTLPDDDNGDGLFTEDMLDE